MTQTNINVMDVIVNKMANGAALSKSLKYVYSTRNVCIPYKEEYSDVLLVDIGLSRRSLNALMRARMRKLGDVIEFCSENKITDVVGVGKDCGMDIFETILDYCWSKMSNNEKTCFLIDTVERNGIYVRPEIEL